MLRSKIYLLNKKFFFPVHGFVLIINCFLLTFMPLSGNAATINGADYSCTDLVPADGDVLSGTFTNVSNFTVDAGTTVYVEPGTALSINASNIIIQGTLDGIGAGYAGGQPSPDPASAGSPGDGPGGGEGGQFGNCVHGSGGGGGGYGGSGGNSGQSLSNPPAALGGATYGSSNPPGVQMGSGGGAAANYCASYNGIGGAGGAGGAAISLIGNTINITGNLLADGEAGSLGTPGASYGAPGGGGGSGGGIEICGQTGSITGALSANGGTGADGTPLDYYQQGGGGGGGGRIKISASIDTSSATITASGGAHGASGPITQTEATDGLSGTSLLDGPSCDSSCSDVNNAIPTLSEWGMIILSLILAGSAFWMIRRRRFL